MRDVIWETFVSLVLPPVFLVLWLVLGLFILFSSVQHVPFVKEYFGILVIVVLIVPIVVFVLYLDRRQRAPRKNA